MSDTSSDRPPRSGAPGGEANEGRGAPQASLLVIAGAAALLAVAFAVQLKSWDVWWHLATGRWIVEHGRIPDTDPFTYTMQGQPWRLVNGIAAVVLYGFHAAFGAAGVVLAKVVFGAVTLGLVGCAARAVGARRGIVLALMAAVTVMVQARYSLGRPLIMGAALVAAGSVAAIHVERERSRAGLAFFALALPLWPYVHGTALVGLAQLGIAVVAVGLGLRRGRRNRRLVAAIATSLVVLLVARVTSWWRELFDVAFGLGEGITATTFTDEWSSGSEMAGRHVGRWLFMIGGLAGGLVAWRQRRVPLGLAALGLVLATRFGRNAYEGVLLAAPGAALGLEAFAGRLEDRGIRLIGAVAPIAAVLALAGVQLATAPRETINRPFGLGVMAGRYPDDALATLEELPVGRLIHGFPVGGYLIWKRSPWGVYCDGRTVALYREDDVQRLFVPLIESDAALTASADRWGAVYGLAEIGSPPQQWMMVSTEWVPLHLARGTVLFARRTVLDALPPSVPPLHLVRWTSDRRWTEGWYRGILRDPRLREQLAGELLAAHRRGPDSPVLVRILETLAGLDPGFAQQVASQMAP